MTRGRQIELEKGMARLDALSPLAVLTRGYSITQKQTGEIVRDSKQANIGERLNIRLSKGRLQAEVSQIEEAAD
jgi:exodeoxyribonuclease VII large subunit